MNLAGEDRNLRLDKAVVVRDQVSVLDGGSVLPGFQLSLRAFFARADRQGPSGEA
jgi:pantothenate kinase type III